MALPVPNLDTKDFSAYFEEAKRGLPPKAPEWTDYNLSDPGITLLELLAWIVDIDTYRLDGIGRKHLLKYLKLLHALPKGVKPAKIWVTLRHTASVTVPKGTKLVASDRDRSLFVPFLTQREITIQKAVLREIILRDERGRTSLKGPFPPYFHPFGERTKKGYGFEMAFEGEFFGEFPLTIVLYERDLPSVGAHGDEKPDIVPSAKVKWECLEGGEWKPLRVKEDATRSFSGSGTVVFTGARAVSGIRCTLVEGWFENAPRIEKILVNTVEALQVEEHEERFESAGSGLPERKIRLKSFPVVDISVWVDGERWNETDTLESHGWNEKVFGVEKERGILLFGDGVHGKIPPRNATILCRYRTSMGAKGNVKAQMEWSAPGVTAENRVEAVGGEDPWTIGEAYRAFAKAFETPWQAVTAKDYEYIATHTPGLRVARARALADRNENRVEVIVVPFGFLPPLVPSEGFLQTVCRHLDRHRLVTTRVKAIPPSYAVVSVKAKLYRRVEDEASAVERRVREALDRFLDPIRGWKDGKGWPFGHTVCRSDISALLEKVAGVECILAVEMVAEGAWERYDGEDIVLKRNALVAPGNHRIVFLSGEERCRSTI